MSEQPADDVRCTCPPTTILLPHRRACPRYRWSTSRAKSAKDRLRGHTDAASS